MANGHGGPRTPEHPAPVKVCNRCQQAKEFPQFSFMVSGKFGLRGQCKACLSADYKRYVQDGGKRVAELRRASKYRQRFQMSIEAVDAMFASAGFQCEVCGTHRDETYNKALVLDHDHACCPGEKTCGQCVRGVLCTKCNVGLGALNDSLRRVESLAKYLKER